MWIGRFEIGAGSDFFEEIAPKPLKASMRSFRKLRLTCARWRSEF